MCAIFVLAGILLHDRVPWYSTAFFLVCLASLLAAFLRGRNDADPSNEELLIDEAGITRTAPGIREHVAWPDIARVRIVTTDEGPWREDVFFFLDARDGSGCVVAHDLAVRSKLLEALQTRLVGVDNAMVIEAMGSTERREFTIWEAANDT